MKIKNVKKKNKSFKSLMYECLTTMTNKWVF